MTQTPRTKKRRKIWDREEILSLGVTTDIITAGEILDTGRTKSYYLANSGKFPVPVFKVDQTYKVRVADLIELLQL